jgi:hypothetical protein
MSLCHETYRRCASVALVLALVLIALPSMLNAQTAPPNAPSAQPDDSYPKAGVFVGYQWLNPGGNVPDQTPPPTGPLPTKLPSMSTGVGFNVSYNFTKNLALEANYGENWKTALRQCHHRRHWTEGHLARRGCGLFRAHAARIRAHQARRYPPQQQRHRSGFLAAAWISNSGSTSCSACLKPTSSGRTKAMLNRAAYRSRAAPSQL